MTVSRRNLPLNALRAFEAAARYCHLRRAAQELGVTHGAVSRQVRQLEENLGVELFDRSHNRLTLTAAGRRLLGAVSDALDRITESTLYLDPDSVAGTLVVAATPSIATGWLLALIRQFGQTYPEIELRLVNIEPQQRNLPADVSVAICFGEPDAPQKVVHELFRERYPGSKRGQGGLRHWSGGPDRGVQGSSQWHTGRAVRGYCRGAAQSLSGD